MTVLDDHHVALPDLNGNHLVDSLRNVVANPHAGLLVLVPGQHETIRIEGAARHTTDADVLDRFTTELRMRPWPSSSRSPRCSPIARRRSAADACESPTRAQRSIVPRARRSLSPAGPRRGV